MSLDNLKDMRIHEECEVGEGQCSIIAKRVNGGILYLTYYGYQVTTSTFVPFIDEENDKEDRFIRGVKI